MVCTNTPFRLPPNLKSVGSQIKKQSSAKVKQRFFLGLKSFILLLFTLTFLLLSKQSVAQCTNDTTSPIAKCKDINAVLNSQGITSVDPQDVDNGSSDNCGIDEFLLEINGGPNRLLVCGDIPFGQNSIPIPAMLTVMDAAGNATICNLVITLEETTPPDIDEAAAPDRTYDCHNLPVGFPNVSVTGDARPGTTDNCDLMSVVFSDVVTGNQPNCYTINRTFTATDEYTNVSTYTQVITVQDNTNPTFQFFPANVNTNCNNGNAYPNPNPNPIPNTFLNTGNYQDNCSSDADITLTRLSRDSRYTYPVVGVPFLNVNAGDCGYYNYTVTHAWTITDECGNSATRTRTITVTDTEAPIVNPTNASGPNVPANGSTTNVSAVNGCGATFPNSFADVNLINNVSDNCVVSASNLDGSFTVTNTATNTVVNSGNTSNANDTYLTGSYVFAYMFSDPCGNASTYSFTINITDNVGPTANCKDGRLSIPPSGVGVVLASSIDNGSVDNCPGALTYAVNPPNFDCGDINTTQMVTLTVTDVSGNPATCTAMVEIVDETGPAPFCKPAEIFIGANGTVTLNPQDIDDGSSDACDYSNGFPGIANYAASPNNFDCDDVGANTVTLTVTDFAGNSSTCTAQVTVTDNTGPSFSCVSPSYTAQLGADGTATIEPGWLIGDGGAIGTDYNLYMQSMGAGGTTNCVNDYSVATGSGSMVSFDWAYDSDDINGSASYVINNGTPVTLSAGSNTNSGNVGPITLNPGDVFTIRTSSRGTSRIVELEITNFVTDFSPNYSGDFDPANWTRSSSCPSLGVPNTGAWIIGASLDDNCTDIFDLIKSLSPNSIIVDCEDIPFTTRMISATDINNNTSNQTCTIQVSDMFDPAPECSNFVAQLDEVISAGSVAVEPGWLIDGERKLYMMSGTSAPNGSIGYTEYTVDVKSATTITFNYDYQPTTPTGANFRDAFGYVKDGVFTALETTGTPNPTGTASVSVASGETFGFRMTTHDQVVVGPDFSGSAKVVISFGSPDFFVGDYDPVQWERDNDNTSWSKYMFTTYEGVFISGTNIGDACTEVCDAELRINDDGTASTDNSTPAAFAFYDCSDAGNTYPGTVTVTDMFGNVGDCTTDLTIIDEVDPIIASFTCPSSGTAVLDSDGEYDTETGIGVFVATFATDNCDIDTYTSEPALLDCSQIGQTIEIKTTVFDDSGNSTFCTTQVTVQDNSEPELLCPAAVTVNCGDSTDPIDTGMATATDNCTVISITTDPNDDVTSTCNSGSFTIVRTWVATDGAGNEDDCEQIITINDNVRPVLSANPPDMTVAGNNHVECGPLPAMATITANDACSGSVPVIAQVIQRTQGIDPTDCSFYNYLERRRFRATDNCGNTITHIQRIEVRDTKAPVVGTFPTANYSTDPNSCLATITDLDFADYITDCAADANLTFSNIIVDGTAQTAATANGTYQPGTYTVSFTVTDPCGNSESDSFTFTVTDNQAPQVLTVDFMLTLSGTNPGTITPQDIDNGSTDNCAIDQLLLDVSSFDCNDVGENIVTLTVIDINGNSNTGTAVVTIVGNSCSSFALTTSSTDENFPGAGNGSVSVSVSPSGNYTYMWTDSNGNSIGNTPTVNGLTAGTYTVKVTDTATNEMATATAVVGSGTAPITDLTFIASMTSDGPNTSAKIAITTENFTNIDGFSFTIDVLLDNVAEVTGVSGFHPAISDPLDFLDVVETSTNSNVVTAGWVGNNAINIPDGSVLFFIDVTLGTTVGSMTDVNFIGVPTPILANQNNVQLVPLTTNGKVSILNGPQDIVLAGNVSTEANVGINNVTLNLSGTSPNTQLADDSYSFTVPAGGNYTITPMKSNDAHNNGVNIFDLNVLLPYIGGDFSQITSPYKLLAANVIGANDPNPQINIFDFIEILRVIGDPDPNNGGGFSQVPSWGFAAANAAINIPNGPAAPSGVPASISYFNVTSSQLNGDFVGYKHGDVNCDANPNSLVGDEVDVRNNESLMLSTINRNIEVGQTYQVDFTAANFNEVEAYQFTLNFDSDYLELSAVSFSENSPLNNDNVYTTRKEDGMMTSVWYNMNDVQLHPSEVLFTLTFEGLRSGAQLSDLVQITSDITPKMAAGWDNEVLDVQVEFEGLVNSTQTIATKHFNLQQNKPNPFSGETLIAFELPKAGIAKLSIMDVSGRVIKVYESTFSSGYNEIKVNAQDLPNAQVLYYRLESEENTAVKKMTVIK